MELWSCLKNGRRQWSKAVTTLINKVLGENEKWVFYFHLKFEGTFWAPKYTQKGFRIHPPPPPPPTHTHTHTHTLGFPGGSADKESSCNVGDLVLIPGLARSPGEGKGYPLQYSGLENSMDCIDQGVTKSRTQLSNFYFNTHTHTLP